MTRNSHPTRVKSCLLFFLALMGLLVIASIVTPAFITAQVEKTFGPPSPNLNIVQRVYLSTLILIQTQDLTQPAHPGSGEIKISIDQGESVTSIIAKLWEAGLINNPGVFRSYLQYSGMDTTLKSGPHTINSSQTPIEIALAMQSSISPDVALSILPGWRLEEIAYALPTTGLEIAPEEFLIAVQHKPEGYSFSSCQPTRSLEGFLYPGSYTVLRGTPMQDLRTQILMNFEAMLTSEVRSGFSAQGLDLCQATTLASIVQREAVVADEMPLIASVFYNRLSSEIALESDPTVQYALGYNQAQATWWTNPLSFQDLEKDSPFNTYIYAGLPPGPISNPGLAAFQAVAFPAQTPYYYFRSACDGSGRHTFSETFSEHLANECP